MRREVVVIDSGLVCAAGSQQQCWRKLAGNQGALSPLDLPGLACHAGRIRDLPGELGCRQRLVALIRQGLGELQPGAGLDRTPLLVATTKGAADEDLADFSNPAHGFAWQVAALIAAELGQTAPRLTVSAACASGTVALIQAEQMIARGEADQVLVVGIDILSRFVLAGFAQLQALATGPCRPFDKGRDGLCLGEGIGLMLLAAKELTRRPALATIGGWGIACDASHITAPCRRASGLSAALAQATNNGSRPVGAINAHGTGTIYNDAMEITAFKNIWGQSPPPFHSVKGAIGHCLGAAGVIEACLAMTALQAGAIPATVGLSEPDCFAEKVGDQAQALTAPAILTCNSGFGGINAALLLNR
jgi:3-oxoacyl-(acyl-carrier-protein) synthase